MQKIYHRALAVQLAAQPVVQDRVGDDVEFQVAFHGAQVTYLENLKEGVEDNEFKEGLKQQVQTADVEVEAAHTT